MILAPKEAYTLEDIGDYIDCENRLDFGDDIQGFAQSHGWPEDILKWDSFWSLRMSGDEKSPTWATHYLKYEEATTYMNENFPPKMPSQENSGVMWGFKLNMSKWGLYSMNNKDNR
jgi:hypothetical protein